MNLLYFCGDCDHFGPMTRDKTDSASEQWHDLGIIQHTHLSHSLLGLAKVPATSFLSQFTILVYSELCIALKLTKKV